MSVQLTHTGAQLDAAIEAVQDNYADVSETTAEEADVRAGKVFVKGNRVQSAGTMPDSTLEAEVSISGGTLTDDVGEYGIEIVPKATIDAAGYVGASVTGERILKYIRTEKRTVTENGTIKPSTNRLISEVTVAVPQAQLFAPTITISGNDLIISNSSNGLHADGFLIIIDGMVKDQIPSSTTTYSLLQAPMTAGTHSIQVSAFGEGMVDSGASSAVTYVATSQLSAPTIAIQNDSLLTIGAVTGADYYMIYADGEIYHEHTVQTTLTKDLAAWLTGKIDAYTITVYAYAYSTYTGSDASNTVQFINGEKLPTPGVSLSGSALVITNSSSSVEKYAIYKDGIFMQYIPSSGTWTATVYYSMSTSVLSYSTDNGNTWYNISPGSGNRTISSTHVRFRLAVGEANGSLSLIIQALGVSVTQNGRGTFETDEILLNSDVTVNVSGS